MSQPGLLGWFKNISITKKLYFTVGVLAMLITLELLTLVFAINTLSSVRGLVTGEGHWSKAQKNAFYYLERYGRTHDNEDYELFQEHVKIILGDSKTRLELFNAEPDLDVARQGFIEGKNHPDDIDGMIKLLRRFYFISYIDRAIKIWTEADIKIAAIFPIAEKMHAEINKESGPSQDKLNSMLQEIDPVNKELTVLADDFSSTLGEGSRWLENIILKLLFAVALTVEITGLIIAVSVSKGLSKGINEIIKTADKVGKGDLDERAQVFSKDEIGHLAETFNSMTAELKVYQSRLERKREQLAEAQQLAKLGRWEWDAVKDSINWSEELAKIYGTKLDDNNCLDDVMKLFVLPEEQQIIRERLDKTIQTNEPLDYFQTIIYKGQDKKGVLHVKGEAVKDRKGNLMKIVGTAQDVTEAKELEKKLIEAKEYAEELAKAKDQFLANMSHEIRTPLNAIIGFTRLLLKSKLTNTQKKELEAIKASGDLLLALINDILDLAKIESGKMTLEKVPISLHSLMDTVYDSFEVRLKEKKIKATKNISKQLPEMVVGDYVRISQILINIISNAIKFTPEKGIIALSVDVIETQNNKVKVAFTVKDSGIGIAQDKIMQIFDPFVQSTTETTREFGGTGLGLSIVKKLVTLMNGAISVDSELGGGSVFRIVIPFEKYQALERLENNVQQLAQQQDVSLNKMYDVSVLLVEDNSINQYLAQTVLKQIGFIVDTADNGKIALSMIEQNNYDVVLMDLMMPELDGFETTICVRNLKDKNKSIIPIIALTADVNKTDVDKCFEIGMNDYISKPFNPDDLQTKIYRLLNDKNNNMSTNKVSNEAKKALCNLDYLNDKIPNAEAHKKELIGMLISQIPQSNSDIRNSLNNNDWDKLAWHVHKLRSSMNVLGMDDEYKEVAKSIEVNAKESINLDEVKSLTIELTQTMDNALLELKSVYK